MRERGPDAGPAQPANPRLAWRFDHIALAPTGVYVIDTKAVNGPVRVDRPLFGKPRLLINGWDRTKYLDGLDKQVAVVRTALAAEDIPIQGVLCFTEAVLPWLRSTEFRGHLLLYQRALLKRLRTPGPLSATTIAALGSRRDTALPRA